MTAQSLNATFNKLSDAQKKHFMAIAIATSLATNPQTQMIKLITSAVYPQFGKGLQVRDNSALDSVRLHDANKSTLKALASRNLIVITTCEFNIRMIGVKLSALGWQVAEQVALEIMDFEIVAVGGSALPRKMRADELDTFARLFLKNAVADQPIESSPTLADDLTPAERGIYEAQLAPVADDQATRREQWLDSAEDDIASTIAVVGELVGDCAICGEAIRPREWFYYSDDLDQYMHYQSCPDWEDKAPLRPNWKRALDHAISQINTPAPVADDLTHAEKSLLFMIGVGCAISASYDGTPNFNFVYERGLEYASYDNSLRTGTISIKIDKRGVAKSLQAKGYITKYQLRKLGEGSVLSGRIPTEKALAYLWHNREIVRGLNVYLCLGAIMPMNDKHWGAFLALTLQAADAQKSLQDEIDADIAQDDQPAVPEYNWHFEYYQNDDLITDETVATQLDAMHLLTTRWAWLTHKHPHNSLLSSKLGNDHALNVIIRTRGTVHKIMATKIQK